MSKKEALIKPTKDGRFWSMGVVVGSIDEAIKRCITKLPGKNIHLEYPPEHMKDILVTVGVCGSPEYIRKFV